MPLLNIYGKYDHLVPPEACERLVNHVGSTDTEDICLDTGHIGIYVSSKFQEAFAPKIAGWLKERDKVSPKRTPRKKIIAKKTICRVKKKTCPRPIPLKKSPNRRLNPNHPDPELYPKRPKGNADRSSTRR
jgi:polyhydroxyalkanoate synthase